MKNLLNTITDKETAVLDRVRDILLASPLYKDYGDKDRLAKIQEPKWIDYRKGIVTIPLVDNCFCTGGHANMKQFAVKRVENLVKDMREGQKLDVKWIRSDKLCDSVDFCVENYHTPKTVNFPKTYGNGALNGYDKKVAKLAAIIKELWETDESEGSYSVVFYLHEGAKVIKASTKLPIEGLWKYSWKYSYENVKLASIMEAASKMLQIRDDQKFNVFNPDSLTIVDKFTNDQYNITL